MSQPVTRDPREALIAWRASTGYSQGEVGALFGVTKQGVGNWEQGRARVPARVQKQLRAEGWLAQSGVTWLSEHDDWLRAHVDTGTVYELATAITETFGILRTHRAIRWRLGRLGLGSQSPHLTLQQVAYFCGVSDQCATHWARRWLQAYRPCVARGAWSIPDVVFVAWLQDHAVQVRPEAMPRSRYRAMAEACWRRDRWLDMYTAAQYAGVHFTTLRYHVARGHLPATAASRTGARYWWMIRARDLAVFLRRRAA